MRRLAAICFALAFSLLMTLPARALDVKDIGLESGQVEEVSAAELDDMRGKYFGFYFAINFVGYWDTVGSVPSAMLTFKAGSPDENIQGVINLVGKGRDTDPGNSQDQAGGGQDQANQGGQQTVGGSDAGGTQSVVSSSGQGDAGNPAVRTSAVIGGGAGANANGILQLTQVPGSKNFVYSGIIFNLLIVNVKDSGADNLRNVLASVLGGPL